MTAAVVFDLYGTLLNLVRDSHPFHTLARRKSGGDVRSALETALTSDNSTLAGFASNIGLSTQDDLAALELSLQNDIETIDVFADVIPTLTALKQNGTLTAVISNLATPYKKPFFSRNLDQLVDVTVFSCDCGFLKPHPKIYELALAQLGSTPHETIMVGDSLKSDVQGPSKIGIMGIHLVRSGGPSRAKQTISSLDGVLEYAT